MTRSQILALRSEGLAALVLSLWGWHQAGLGWGLFALLLLAPDLALLGYAGGRRLGALVYNVAHSYTLAGAVLLLGLWTEQSAVLAAGLILAAHIGLDRTVGYGLKSADDPKITHLSLP